MAELYGFQREGVDRLHALKGRALLGDSMGLGKTIQVLTFVKESPKVRPVIIVVPASLKYHWAREAANHTGLRVEVVESRKPPAWATSTSMSGRPQILVASYDVLDALWRYFVRLRPMLVVADECQAVANPQAKRTKALRDLLRTADVPHFIAVSGTPITNRPIEFWPVLNMLHPKKFPSYHAFGHKWCNAKKKPWGWDYSGAGDVDRLHRILKKRVMIRRLKKDVLKDLPDKQRNVVGVEVSGVAEYRKAEREFTTWLKANYGKKQADKALRAEALAKTTYLKRLAAQLKVGALREWVESFLESTGEKLIVFATHRAMVKEFATGYAGRCAVVTGEVTGRNRQKEFDRFNADPKCRLFIGNLQAAGAGWSASCCSTVAFLELGWTPGAHLQAEDRVHGINRGVKGVKSQSYYLVAEGTIETRICDLIRRKQDTLDKVLDGGRTEDMSVFDELMRELAK